ncbi:MAG TPA: hypothetical protein VJI68_02750 [Candidatus Nanoarchaeia archaeon]|nr:hypothetical protein [Candidatus Nanoarchaeia archaeon]
MGFFDKIKSIFKGNENLSSQDIKKINSGNSTGTYIDDEKPLFEEAKPNDKNKEALEILDSVKIDKENLALDRIENEGETVYNYAKSVIKDLSKYDNLKNKKDQVKEALNAIKGKFKHINIHSLELKNLLANLEDHYYVVVIDILKKVNDKVNNDEISKVIDDVENDLELVKQLDSQLTKVIAYNDLFNPEKNKDYESAIEREAEKRLIHGDLNDLIDRILITVVNKSIGIKNKIERNNPLEQVKQFI